MKTKIFAVSFFIFLLLGNLGTLHPLKERSCHLAFLAAEQLQNKEVALKEQHTEKKESKSLWQTIKGFFGFSSSEESDKSEEKENRPDNKQKDIKKLSSTPPLKEKKSKIFVKVGKNVSPLAIEGKKSQKVLQTSKKEEVAKAAIAVNKKNIAQVKESKSCSLGLDKKQLAVAISDKHNEFISKKNKKQLLKAKTTEKESLTLQKTDDQNKIDIDGKVQKQESQSKDLQYVKKAKENKLQQLPENFKKDVKKQFLEKEKKEVASSKATPKINFKEKISQENQKSKEKKTFVKKQQQKKKIAKVETKKAKGNDFSVKVNPIKITPSQIAQVKAQQKKSNDSVDNRPKKKAIPQIAKEKKGEIKKKRQKRSIKRPQAGIENLALSEPVKTKQKKVVDKRIGAKGPGLHFAKVDQALLKNKIKEKSVGQSLLKEKNDQKSLQVAQKTLNNKAFVDSQNMRKKESERPKKQQGYLINYRDVGIIEYLGFISKITKKNFIFDEDDLQFTVTVISEKPTSVDMIMAALIQILRVHNLMLIEEGDNLIIHANPTVNSPGVVVTDQTPFKEYNNAEVMTRVFQLNTLEPIKASEIVKPLLSEQAFVDPISETGHLVVTDIATNVNRIHKLLRSLDSPSNGLEIGRYQVRTGVMDTLVSMVEKMMLPMTEDKSFVLVPHYPTGVIYIVSTPFLIRRAITLFKQLDTTSSFGQAGGRPGAGTLSSQELEQLTPEERARREAEERARKEAEWTADLPVGHIASTEFYIHKLQYRKGDQIQEALQKIAESLAIQGESDLITTINSTQWLESTNSLILTGTKSSLRKIRELIKKVDVPVRQVFIEMLILETTIDESLTYGVDWGSRFGGNRAAGAQAFLTGANPLSLAMDTVVPGSTIDPSGLARTDGYNMGVIGRSISKNGTEYGSIGALVEALHQDTKNNVLLTPKILVEDATPAEIFVGVNTAFQDQAISNDRGSVITTNVEFRDVGTRLKVTPFIGENNVITLEIEQEVSTVTTVPSNTTITGGTSTTIAAAVSNPDTNAPQTSTAIGPTTRKATTMTRVHVPNNFFLILSGMIQNDRKIFRNQVPCLGGIPILGAAFSHREYTDSKRNLMLFIRPHIVETPEEIMNTTRHQQDIFKEGSREKNRWQFEVDQTREFMNLRNPNEPCDYFNPLFHGKCN